MTDTAELLGNVVNPTSTTAPDNSSNAVAQGRQSELLVSEIHGTGYVPNYRGKLFWANRSAIAIPQVTNNMVSVFSLYNPVGSGVNLELVDIDIGMCSGTIVVDTIGLYYSTQALTAKGTFTTLGTALNSGSGQISNPVGGSGQFYSAYTHSGTPVRCANLCSYGAAAITALVLQHYDFMGKIIIPPGIVVSLAVTTATPSTSSDVNLRWSEYPV